LNEERDHHNQSREHSFRARSEALKEPEVPPLHSIHQGQVVNIKEFGIFVKLNGFSKHGLVHISQISNHRVEASDIPQIVDTNEPIWVKVIQVGMDENGNNKLSLSMKYVKQSDGTDLDPNNVNLTMEQQRGKATPAPYRAPRFELGAILDTLCTRCGGKGHFASECFHIKGEEIQPMLSDEEDAAVPHRSKLANLNASHLKEHLKDQIKDEKEKDKEKTQKHKSKKRKKSSKDKSKKEKEKDKSKKKKKKHKH